MGWNRRRKKPPWYRAPDCKARLSEAEKKRFDALRAKEPHPAATYGVLTEAVRSYISKTEIEFYDLKQDRLAATALFWIGIGLLLIFLNYFGHIGPLVLTNASPSGIVWGVVAIVASIAWYSSSWRRNADERFQMGEQILENWEWDQLRRSRYPEE